MWSARPEDGDAATVSKSFALLKGNLLEQWKTAFLGYAAAVLIIGDIASSGLATPMAIAVATSRGLRGRIARHERIGG